MTEPMKKTGPMKRIVLTRGLASGAILAALWLGTLPLCMNGTIDFSKSELLGYSSMVLAFLLVFFGIRTYRQEVGGGTIGFGKAFQVGILITLITCLIYVLAWQVVYWGFWPDFLDELRAFQLERMRADGASEAAIAEMQTNMATFARLYRNPLFNMGVTFLEVFPVGLIVTLVSALILRRRPVPGAPAGATAVA
jgi:hypothetical protein